MISAVILAAGQSRRMGQPKINLPWGRTTVLGWIIQTLQSAGVQDIWIVTGKHPASGLDVCQAHSVHFVVNPVAETGGMLSSLKVGLRHLPESCTAALVVLGDHPQMEVQTVQSLLEAYLDHPGIIVPSFQMRRGHPWLLDRRYWHEVLALESPQTLRDYLTQKNDEIYYIDTDTPTILADLDTPEDYERYRPKNDN